MKVKDLIEFLQNHPEDMDVTISTEYGKEDLTFLVEYFDKNGEYSTKENASMICLEYYRG